MPDETGPDILGTAERRAILRRELEREKDRRRAAEAEVERLRGLLAGSLPDGDCQHCGGGGCVACSARYLVIKPEPEEGMIGPQASHEHVYVCQDCGKLGLP